MSKAVLISINPRWCSLIASGKKTIEVRKTKPNLLPPFRCYIYCTTPKTKNPHEILEIHGVDGKIRKGNGMVIGEFVCDSIFALETNLEVHYELPGSPVERWHEWNEAPDGFELEEDIEEAACLSFDEIEKYIGAFSCGYFWHISSLYIYDKPLELSEFRIVDNEAVQKCEYREITGQPEYKTAHNGWIKGSYVCDKDSEPDWCTKCKTKPITRPPQSWCYVEELQ